MEASSTSKSIHELFIATPMDTSTVWHFYPKPMTQQEKRYLLVEVKGNPHNLRNRVSVYLSVAVQLSVVVFSSWECQDNNSVILNTSIICVKEEASYMHHVPTIGFKRWLLEELWDLLCTFLGQQIMQMCWVTLSWMMLFMDLSSHCYFTVPMAEREADG